MLPTDYSSTLDYLYARLPMYQRVGAAAYKNDLTNTYALCKALDNPQHKFKSVHVAGTNGKGSSSHMLAAILQTAGYKTGLYTSPHLKEFTERIKINGREIEKEFVVDFVTRIKPVIEQIEPSFFELTVAMAFDYFARANVDIAVIEVGLGGRLDSTNVITPVLSMITNISLDHKDMLGDTLEKIAFEKAGIIKEGIPIVISERQPAVEQVFRDQSASKHASLCFASDHIQMKEKPEGIEAHVDGDHWLTVHPELKGDYQLKNLPGVLVTVRELRKKGFNITDDAVRTGLGKAASLTGLKGRWQKVGDAPLTICDTGHNPAGIRMVVEQIKGTPHKHLHFVFGAVKEKDLAEIFTGLPKEASYYFCQASIPRAMDAAELARQAGAFGLFGKVIPRVNDAVREARASSGKDDLVFIGGSTFVVAEIDGL